MEEGVGKRCSDGEAAEDIIYLYAVTTEPLYGKNTGSGKLYLYAVTTEPLYGKNTCSGKLYLYAVTTRTTLQ